jgi:zinc protease
VIVISTPNGATHPDEAQVRASVTAGLGDPIFPLLDETPSEPLMAVPPRPGEVVNVAYDRGAEATVWTLGNGVRVVVKPTNFRNDRIVIEGWQSGGTSAIADPDFGHARFAAELVGMSGAGKFDARTLSRLLAGKDVSVSINLAELGQQVSASARPEDLETMFQLLHLRLTRPRQYKNAFELMKNKYVEGARHRNDASDQRFSDEIAKLANGDHPRRRPISAAMLDDVDPDKALAIWKDRFSDFDDFTFAVVGNLDLDQLKPLVATYLGSLPSKRFHDHAWKNIRIQHPEGKIEKTVLAGKEARSRLWVEFSAPMPWTPDLMRDGRILERLLRIRLREILREDLGGAYTVTADVSINREPEERGTVHLAFSCAPDNVDHLRDALFAELARIAGGQIGDEILAKVSEQLRRHHEINRQSNKWWAGRLRDAYYFGQNFAEMNDIEPVIKRVNAANVAAVARRLFDDKRYLLGILRPAGS